MFAITFDLIVREIERHHPNGVSAAYGQIAKTLKSYEFEWVQGSVYVTENNNMANMATAILALRNLPWFPKVVRDVRAFRVEDWSDFTAIAKGLSPK